MSAKRLARLLTLVSLFLTSGAWAGAVPTRYRALDLGFGTTEQGEHGGAQ